MFPVELEIFSGQEPSSGLLQAFTSNISKGGLCLELKSFGREGEKLLHRPDARLELIINTAFGSAPIRAKGRIAWLRRDDRALPAKFWIGVEYTEIDDASRGRIFNHARRLVWMPRLAMAVLAALALGSAALYFNNRQLVAANEKLVLEQVESAERKSSVSSQLYQLQKRKAALEAELSSLRSKKDAEKETLEAELESSRRRQAEILGELTELKSGTEKLQQSYRKIERTEARTSTASLKQMADWVHSHQNHRTGLVASFEGDPSLEGTAFTYDQALAVQVFLLTGDTDSARQVLRYYTEKAQKRDGGFFNAYNAIYGASDEATVHTGPNIWLGIAALQYEQRVRDGEFVPLARGIADWVITLTDSEGGIHGGPGLKWYSTEHHLDAYAFFNMLSAATGDSSYRAAADRTLAWIKKYAYSNSERRLNRGKGDATIATDTFSWAICAVGPSKLTELGFDVDAIMDFAEKNCEVEVSHTMADGKEAQVRGFDFAKAQNAGRGGIISAEWTAQMIVAYQVLARYYDAQSDTERAERYRLKGEHYLNELQKLTITSPSRTGQGRGCLPYASLDNVDTGHGWRTPKGRSTGSVAATAYAIFAGVGYNPFDLSDHHKL